ncbi:MAG: hypothetical protein IPL28_27765 [Chloroflexi bacterium]|nr:hypothetical protein [Chloroflexota bacterium]
MAHFPQGLPFVVEGFVGGAALPCALTSPMDWVSAAPNSGTTAAGDATAVEVTFDSTGLSMGTYQGYLCVNSNDAVTPQISIPVSLTVTSSPVLINLNLSEVTSTQDAGTTTNQDLEIGNPGGGTLNWDIDEVDGFLRPVASADVVESVETISFAPQAGFGLTGSGLSASAGLTALPAAQRVPNQTITHSTSQTVVTGSISCNAGGLHADNSYWRAFDLPAFGINGAFAISSVDVGVETANGASGSQPVVLRLYAAPSGTAFPAAFPGSFNLIATENVNVANQTLSLLNIPVAAVVPANSVLVMELFTPSGQATNNSFFVGSNAGGQSAPSYISAASCGITAPTDLAGIGFGNMHIVMNVTGEETVAQTCDTAVDIPWLTLTPTSGSAGAGITNTVNVALDSTGLPAGVYTGTLCVNSNASNAPLVEVPVAMTVTVPTGSSIDMAMTVGTDSSVCAATDEITVASGTEVTYCYTVTNTGAITLTQHDLADTELGTVLNGFAYSLAPGASAFITATTTLTATTVSTATWTAYNPGPTNTATASDSATVNMAAGNATVTYCRNAVNIAIPDDTPAGVSDVQTVTESGTIVDVNFFVNATHTWNGDVIFTPDPQCDSCDNV